jgi:hypothetical protein
MWRNLLELLASLILIVLRHSIFNADDALSPRCYSRSQP